FLTDSKISLINKAVSLLLLAAEVKPELQIQNTSPQEIRTAGCHRRVKTDFSYLQLDFSLLLSTFLVSRSAFSVALSLDQDCFGPFNDSRIIIYKHAFFILGGSYSLSTGIFTVTRSGVYSLSVTIYGAHVSGETMSACANLEVNGKGVSSLLESNGQDLEDSATVVLAVNLTAGDEVAVILPKDCVLCDHNNYNTFTGFLLYTTA
uniref:Cerebellin 20 n=1 Tax=Labrus bergylta TaxID=56723 RepID=A0A3Q3F773_9LABR